MIGNIALLRATLHSVGVGSQVEEVSDAKVDEEGAILCSSLVTKVHTGIHLEVQRYIRGYTWKYQGTYGDTPGSTKVHMGIHLEVPR